MLFYAVVFIFAGFFLGIFVKHCPAVRLCIYFSIGWAFAYGFWAIPTFFELIFGIYLSARFIEKMERIVEEDSSDHPNPVYQTQKTLNYTEIYPSQQNNTQYKENNDEENENTYSSDEIENRKDPAVMSEAEKFFELYYLFNIISQAINDPELQEGLLQSSMTGTTNILIADKVKAFHKILYRLSEITQKSLPELLDNDCKGLNKCIKKANSGKAIQKAVKQLLEEKGEKALADRIAELLNQHVEHQETAKEYVLQELDAASYGDDIAQNFVSQSGFNKDEYKGAMNHSSWENDDTVSHLQQFTRVFTLKIDNLKTMRNVNLMIVDYIMEFWKLGKYEKKNSNLLSEEEMDDSPF